MAVRPPRRPPPPLDAPALERLALRYVERFATTRAKLVRYLTEKIRARGWDGEGAPDPVALADRFAALGYIDDRAFATARAGALTRRGLGAVRVHGALRQAGVAAADAAVVTPILAEGKVSAALALARRKRIGPFAAAPPDRALREKQLAVLVRGGHSFTLAKAIVALLPGEDAAARLTEFEATSDEADPGYS